jgi:hypothetical protein
MKRSFYALLFATTLLASSNAHAVLTGKCTGAGCMQLPTGENSDSSKDGNSAGLAASPEVAGASDASKLENLDSDINSK